ncbi:MAG: cytochrome D1 domain-containing protein [Hydrogenothermaceae bacterium]
MKKFFAFLALFVFVAYGKERLFIIERETSSVAVVEDGKFIGRIENLHNLNHAVIKFYGKKGYLITRDGYLIKFDPENLKAEKEIKVGESSIGFVVDNDYIAVANYSTKSVIILDKDLNILQQIETDSRNVGIKNYKDYLVFALMDKDELWVLKRVNGRFNLFKRFKNVGQVPFDAMIKDNLYIVGFFNSPFIGVLNLDDMRLMQVFLLSENKEPVLKVPHFGMWAIEKDKIVIPSVGDKSINIFDNDFNIIKKVNTIGLPVFTVFSPDGKLLAITFSGKEFNTIQIVDINKMEITKTLTFDGKILHVRWSEEKPLLYISVNDSNKVICIDTIVWEEKFNVQIIKPSGIFLYKKE